MKKRLIELETRAAYQEDTLSKLDEVVVRQQLEIDQLSRQVDFLQQQLRQMVASQGAESDPADPPPPHY